MSKTNAKSACSMPPLVLLAFIITIGLLWHFANRPPNSGAALAAAAQRGDVAGVRALLDAGADPNGVDINSPWDTVVVAYYVHCQGYHSERPIRRPALCWAATYGHEEIVDLLLSHGADVRATDARGENALHRATARGHSRIVTRLLAHRTPIDAKSHDGMTALMMAAKNETVKLFSREARTSPPKILTARRLLCGRQAVRTPASCAPCWRMAQIQMTAMVEKPH